MVPQIVYKRPPCSKAPTNPRIARDPRRRLRRLLRQMRANVASCHNRADRRRRRVKRAEPVPVRDPVEVQPAPPVAVWELAVAVALDRVPVAVGLGRRERLPLAAFVKGDKGRQHIARAGGRVDDLVRDVPVCVCFFFFFFFVLGILVILGIFGILEFSTEI
jgi:hypothetical protein